LLVDDNVEFLEAARRLLERQGISVVAVATGSEEARRQFRELQPDVVLVDVNLGTESGFDLARELAASPSGSTTRVILISTYAEPASETPSRRTRAFGSYQSPSSRDSCSHRAGRPERRRRCRLTSIEEASADGSSTS
jgi:CheY-like chemotaxis protein